MVLLVDLVDEVEVYQLDLDLHVEALVLVLICLLVSREVLPASDYEVLQFDIPVEQLEVHEVG